MAQPSSEPYSTLEVSRRDPETFQKEAVAYPDHSYPQAVPVEHVAAGATHSYYSPETDKQVVGQPPQLYPPPVGVLPPAYKGSEYAGAVAYTIGGAGYYANGAPAYPDSSAYPPSSVGTMSTAAYTTPLSPLPPQNMSDQYLPGEGEKPARAATICGLRRKTFWIILLIVVLVIVALIAGVAGGLASRGRDQSISNSANSVGSSGDTNGSDNNNNGSSADPGSSGATSSGEKLILGNSKLTASNWTDASGVVHRTVFFQDAHNAIIARRWDSQGKSWKTNNLTQLMAATTTPLNPLPGTPLTSASMDLDPVYETHVWFLNPRNIMQSMASFDALKRPDSWENDTMDGAVLETWPGSQLSGMWQRCGDRDCNGTWIVAYQRPEGAIKTANSSTWPTSTVAVESKDVAANSSMAVIPKLRGPFLDRLELVSETIRSGDGVMRMTSYDDTWNEADTRVTELLTDIPVPAPTQQFAATKWDNWRQGLYIALLQGGNILGRHFDGQKMNSISNFQFLPGPRPDFTAIAMSPDAMFYGIANDEVLEYRLDQSDPSKFNFVGRVFP
ncbi:hypothetical protein GGS23DRAFT_479023 [Durotheca rogersii]|uniref:uncharacterized protein n=1 Tax=Durotheca rogersii TaxID=419775 RepID=UPI00221EB065|nr:uncharacterized protein GGS23DRAFT_479023 [Durotheca rogersii]KAI5864020.1 hypothetical protein GGS23DRAFT_479023 [Durotheca rogersii]